MDELAWNQLRAALVAMAREQRFALDEVKLQGALLSVTADNTVGLTPNEVERVCLQAGWLGVRALPQPARERLPLLVRSHHHGWGLLTQGSEGDDWLLVVPGQSSLHIGAADLACLAFVAS